MNGKSQPLHAEGTVDYSEILDGRSIRYLYDIGGRTVRLECRIRGKIEHIRQMKNAAFTTLDTSDKLQLIFDRQILGDREFDELGALKPGVRIDAWVVTEYAAERSPPIRLLVQRHHILPSGPLAARRTELGREYARTRIELASIARSMASYLSSEGWAEAAPLTISTALDEAVEPLEVIFPGLGAETSLVVSPLAELFEIAELTNTASVFSVSRIYSRAIRDGLTSPEALALIAVHIGDNTTEEWNLELSQTLIEKAFSPIRNRLSERDRELLHEQWERRRSRAIAKLPEISAPVHQITPSELGVAYRTVWPHPISLVEGNVRFASGGVLHSTIVHCERILHLVSGVPYRRLQDTPKLTQGANGG